MKPQDFPTRVLPALDPDTEFFWTSGRDGRLRFLRCQLCDLYIHPPSPVCPRCQRRDVAPTAVSGDGTVFSVTVNHHSWTPDQNTPFVIALVEIAEQAGLRLTTNIVGCSPDRVTVGLGVHVVFENHDPIYLPLFVPLDTDDHAEI